MQRYLLSAATATSALAASLFLSACGGSGEHGSTPTLDVRSTLAFGACAVPIADPVAVCGTLTVPEDRLDNTSRLIGLPFVVLPATTPQPAKEPTVIFTGGPGPSPLRTLADLPAEALLQNPLRQTRDVIVMTQRGTDLTLPQSLDCNELVLDFAAGERFASEDAVVAAATACRNRLVAAGAKLSAYTTKAIAHDMEELRLLLGQRRGFKQWNVVGSSYGSKLALAYMRDAPAGVRSAVLDGPAPLQSRDLYDAGVLDALSNIVNACNANAVCAAAYPGLQPRFAAAVERLQNAPATVRGTAVRGVDILNALRAALSVPQAPYGKLPMFMDFVARGDVACADALLPFVDNVLLAINPEGMFYTVTCTDDAGLSNQANNELPPLGAGWPDAVRQLIARGGLGLQARTCPLWTQGQTLSTDVLKPLRSDIRTLITVGQFDAATPAVGADTLLVDLPRAHKVVFTGRGHGLLESDVCALQVMAAFIDDPRQSPDVSCVDSADSLQFLTPASVAAEQWALQQGIEEFLRLQPLIPSVMARLESPGGAQAWSGSAGVVDRTGHAPAGPETAFRIASVTKTFTAAATHRLVELGHVTLGDAIALHLLPATAATLRQRGYEPDKMTVAHLLAHSAGIPNYDSAPYHEAVLAEPGHRWTRHEQMLFALDHFAKEGAPGAVFAYSDTGYNLLGEIIEQKTGLTLGAAYRSLLGFSRLGMSTTWMEVDEPAPPLAAGFAHAYADDGTDLRGVDATADSYGGGGLVSTVGDLTRFFRALFEGRVLAPASLMSMQTLFEPNIPAGHGIFLLPLGTQTCWLHEGFWGVGVYYCPESRTSVAVTLNLAVLSQGDQPNPSLDVRELAAALIERAAR